METRAHKSQRTHCIFPGECHAAGSASADASFPASIHIRQTDPTPLAFSKIASRMPDPIFSGAKTHMLGVISNSHGRADAVATAVDLFSASGVQSIIHCGDVGGRHVLDVIARIG